MFDLIDEYLLDLVIKLFQIINSALNFMRSPIEKMYTTWRSSSTRSNKFKVSRGASFFFFLDFCITNIFRAYVPDE